MAKAGRPKKQIDQVLFDKIIPLPLRKEDVANILEVSEASIERYVKARFNTNFETLRRQKEQRFRKNILSKQYEMALKGNVTLLIWLGKQYLGQTDKVDNTHQLKDPYQTMSDEQLIAEVDKIDKLLANSPKKINAREVKEVERSEIPIVKEDRDKGEA